MRRRTKPPITIPPACVSSFHMQGLRGRIVRVPAKNTHTTARIVLVSGLHTSHERMYAFAQFLSNYAEVTMIDLPGFGGMNSFKSIGKDITYENYADYIYAVLKTQKLTKDVTVFAISIGSQFVTRMLQMHPECQSWFKKYIALVGIGAAKDFKMNPIAKFVDLSVVYTGSTRIGALCIRHVFLNRLSLFLMLRVFALYKQKMQSEDPSLQKAMLQMEMHLWRENDVLSQARTSKLMFTKDLREYSQNALSIEFHNIMAAKDQYFSSKEVSKTFRDIFSNYKEHSIRLGVHMPSLVDGESEVAKLFEPALIDEIMNSK